MAWGWLGFIGYLILTVFLLSRPKHLSRHFVGSFLCILTGIVVEYGLKTARPLWEGTHYFIPLGRVELSFLIVFYGVQGLFFFQYLPRLTSLQIPYTLFLAFSTALTEQLLAIDSFNMIGTGGWYPFVSSLVVHSIRLLALLGIYYASNYEERAEELKERQTLALRLRRSLQIWMFIWPSMGLIAFSWIKLMQRFSRSPQ